MQAGDQLAAERLYQRFSGAMLLVSTRITQDRMASEDILQEVFLKSFTRIESLQDKSRYGGWLKRMIVNASIDYVKNRKDWKVIDEDYELPDEKNEAEIPGINADQIEAAIGKLPPKCRTVFSLYLIESYSHAEVAELLHISLSTSKSQYQYALKLLRNELTVIKSKAHE